MVTVTPSDTIDLAGYLDQDANLNQITTYDLSAIIVHHGNSMHTGHYTCKHFIKYVCVLTFIILLSNM
jgi:hypothetical protein